MNEEIETEKLQKLIDRCNQCKFATCENCDISWNEVKAIENLIKENKELKVITDGIKVLETDNVPDDTYYVITKRDFLNGSYKNLLDDYIPKSKIKEKIEELEKRKDEYTEQPLIYHILKNQLKELLEQ